MLLAALGFFIWGAASAQSVVPIIQQLGDVRSAAQFAKDCAAGVGLSNCVTPSTPRNCQSSMHWTTAGSGIAHCVSDDPPCSYPSHLEHDYLGNPSCVPPVVTTGYEYLTQVCPAGYMGPGIDQRRDVTYYDGVPAAYGSWQTTAFNCQLMPPPAPPRPPAFQGVAIDTYPLAYSNREHTATVGVTFMSDGTWAASGVPLLMQGGTNGSGKKPNSGRWNSGGYNSSEFEIHWKAVLIERLEPIYQGAFLNEFSASSPEGQWTSLGGGWTVTYKDYGFSCSPGYTADLNVTIRLKSDPSQQISGRLWLQAKGWGDHCYG